MSVEKLSNALDTIVNAMAEKYPLGTDFERYNDEIRTIVSWASDYLETLEQAGDRAGALAALDEFEKEWDWQSSVIGLLSHIPTIRQALLSPESVAKAPVWQPIDTYTPRVENVLIAGGDYYHEQMGHEHWSPIVQPVSAFWNEADQEWEIANTSGMYQWSKNPTHWMALPAVPDSDGGV